MWYVDNCMCIIEWVYSWQVVTFVTVRIKCTAYNFQLWWLEESSTGYLLAAQILNLFLPIFLVLPVLRAVGYVHSITGPLILHLTGWLYAASILESVPAQGWLTTISSVATELIVDHIMHILLNPNEMHLPLKFSFAEFPKCPQLLQCHLPQGEVWWKGNQSVKETVFKLSYCSRFYINMWPCEHIFGTPHRAL